MSVALANSDDDIAQYRSGMEIRVSRLPHTVEVSADMPDLTARGVAALAAAVEIPRLNAKHAAQRAEAVGLVCHLTSLVVTDAEAESQAMLPATRKVLLSTPRVSIAKATHSVPSRSRGKLTIQNACDNSGRARSLASLKRIPRSRKSAASAVSASEIATRAEAVKTAHRAEQSERGAEHRKSQKEACRAKATQRLSSEVELTCRLIAKLQKQQQEAGAEEQRRQERTKRLARQINWNACPDQLRSGDLSLLPKGIAKDIRRLARLSEIIEMAGRLGLTPLALVIGLLARSVADHNRCAKRLARQIFDKMDESQLKRLERRLASAKVIN